MLAQPPKLTGVGPRVRLTVIRGPGEGQTIGLTRAVALIGSRPGCKVVLRHPSVAPVHSALVSTGSEVFLRDMGAPASTYLNDLRAECERLDHGFVIKVAPWEFQVDFERPDSTTHPAGALLDLEPTRSLALQVGGNGRLIKLHREVSLIGRRPGSDVVLQHARVSRAHALVFHYLGEPAVCDLLSENGLWRNGERTTFAPLHSGDVLEMGTTSLRVIIPDSAHRPSAKPDTRTGTGTAVIELEDDTQDKMDIRAAEFGPRDAV